MTENGNVVPFHPAPPSRQRKARRRDHQECMDGLRELVGDPYFGPAARTAIRCVEERGANAGLMLLVLEQAQEGAFWPHQGTGNGKSPPERR